MLIYNIKTDKDNTTGNYLAMEKAFFLRINRPGTQKTKQDFESNNEIMRLGYLCVDSL
jgi:hypothetical protein